MLSPFSGVWYAPGMPPRYDPGYAPYRFSFGGLMTPAIKILIIINAAVYLFELIVFNMGGGPAMLHVLALDPALVFGKLFVWQLVTYLFLHSPSGPWHLVFNMIILWMFGSDIERVWGARRFTRYYLLTGVGAGMMNCLFNYLLNKPWPTIGASGAIFGVIVAYAMLFPNRTILFMLIFPMKARQFAILLAAIELISLGAFTQDGVARLAHLGGALTGYLLLKGLWNPRRIWDDLRWKLRRRRFKTISRDDRHADRDRFYPFH
ncbi:MAG: rhomboid family intramembrane serine protease [Acidobacteriota bacterium]